MTSSSTQEEIQSTLRSCRDWFALALSLAGASDANPFAANQFGRLTVDPRSSPIHSSPPPTVPMEVESHGIECDGPIMSPICYEARCSSPCRLDEWDFDEGQVEELVESMDPLSSSVS